MRYSILSSVSRELVPLHALPGYHSMPSIEHERCDALPPGAVLRDFTLQAVIGHGGFGIVYRAEHNELNLTVAIKEYLPVELAVREGAIVRPRRGTDRRSFEDGLRRFRDEAQVLIDFDSHPSILSCRDFFRAHGTAYLVMAYENGQSLAEVLARREAKGHPFTESDLLAVMVPVLEGLARVHAAGVLHRDIKPSNILIRYEDERPVLIDFGAAKQGMARFSKSQAPYTEGYAALEQVADAGKLGPWTDIYGAGAVMWRMVAGGNRPWEPPDPVRVEHRSHAALGEAADPLPLARELGEGRFPPLMLETIDRCLRLRETERVQNSRELLRALHVASDRSPAALPEWAARQASEQESKSRPAAAVPEPRTIWRRFGWLAIATLAVGLGIALAIWRNLDSEETVLDEDPAGASDVLGGSETATEEGRASDASSSPNQRTPSRKSPLETNKPDRDSTGPVSGGEKERPEAGTGRNRDDNLEPRQNRSQDRIEKPWIKDWNVLGDIQDPGFAEQAKAYIARYGRVPQARDLVVQVEGLLAELRELEAEFTWIPEGSFLMGSPDDGEGLHGGERQHEVRISDGFWMKKNEVTQGEWEAVMDANPSWFSNCAPCPVEQVSWEDTQEFIRRLNERESGSVYRYRLPTEAEWEYAARAGAGGVRYGKLASIAWNEANSGKKTHPVGQKQANGWGLHDMLGNVWEWTADWHGEYPSNAVTDPEGPRSGSRRVLRGGGWTSSARDVRYAVRSYASPVYRSDYIGIRLVRSM